MRIETKKLNDLIIPQWYAKTDSAAEMARLKTSIGEFGYIVPIVVNSVNNHVLDENLEDGHVFVMNDDVNTVRYLKNSSFRFEEFYVADFGFAALVNNRPNLQHILVSHETKGNPYRPDITSEDFNSIIKMKYRGTLDDDRTSHFHQKSIAFIQLFIEKFARSKVLDVFGGSGSTLLACEKAGKSCYMMEFEPEYCQLIIDRWEAATGKQAERIG